MGDHVGPGYDFDGLYGYSPNGNPDDQLPDLYGTLLQRARFDAAIGIGDRQRLLAAPVSPGEDDSALDRDQKTVVDRRAG